MRKSLDEIKAAYESWLEQEVTEDERNSGNALEFLAGARYIEADADHEARRCVWRFVGDGVYYSPHRQSSALISAYCPDCGARVEVRE
jgi:hypothetical protein